MPLMFGGADYEAPDNLIFSYWHVRSSALWWKCICGGQIAYWPWSNPLLWLPKLFTPSSVTGMFPSSKAFQHPLETSYPVHRGGTFLWITGRFKH